MLHRIIVLVATAIFVFTGLSFGVSADMMVDMIYPDRTQIITSTAQHYIMGIANPDYVSKVEISRYAEKSAVMRVNTSEIGRDFALLVKDNFPDDFYISFLEYKAEYATNLHRNKEMDFVFPTNERIDRQTFWQSKEFKKLYAQAVKDSNAVKITIGLEGNVLSEAALYTRETEDSRKTFFISRLELGPGSNDVLLVTRDNRGQVVEEIPYTYIYKAKIDSKTQVPAGFEPPVFHGPDQPSICLECHTTDFASSEYDPSTILQECYRCHSWTVEKKYVHGPVSTWECLICHVPNAGATQDLLKPSESVDKLCYECHDTFEKQMLSHTVIHGPVSLGDCTLCHSPHATNNESQIWMPVTELCTTCHGEKYYKDHPIVGHPVMADMDPSDPNENLSCVSCHSPHSSNSDQLFYTAKSVFALCQECHQK